MNSNTSMAVTRGFDQKFALLPFEQQQELLHQMELVWEGMNSGFNTPPPSYPQIFALGDPLLFYFQTGHYIVTFQVDEQTIIFTDIVTQKELWR